MIIACAGDELSRRQTSSIELGKLTLRLNLTFKIKVNRPRNNRDLNRVVFTFGPNLVILAWMAHKLSRGQTSDCYTQAHTGLGQKCKIVTNLYTSAISLLFSARPGCIFPCWMKCDQFIEAIRFKFISILQRVYYTECHIYVNRPWFKILLSQALALINSLAVLMYMFEYQ